MERRDLILLGALIGTSSRWDHVGDWIITAYNYSSNSFGEGLGLHDCNRLQIMFEEGVIACYDTGENEPKTVVEISDILDSYVKNK